ncbi:hypothetical protein ETAA8_46510 [Anatilimnocola aggregata]|uniref:Plasmid related protein n=1 Tax=Anatilimnocola aggregata TaxID=2528021 RepID=A0A517YH39_9BACT|nr:hypothetical protein [Anatilimnocola aggregata]QDU29537.1 hypothetical protein ETAA8_46510 [Anatilimnocola aggregata]
MKSNNPQFPFGQVVATPAALEALEQAGQTPSDFLSRHACGDWGEALCEEDKALKDEALKDGSRLLSAYRLKTSTKIWIVTEAQDDNGQRAATTILLPEDY